MVANATTPRVVRKPLADDCLLDGELHPAIALRLERVRELPMTGVANFYGVERVEGKPHLVWEHVEGRTLEDELVDAPPERVTVLRREVELALETMHAMGLVHGAVHARNIIVDPRGQIRLTHVAPLLFDDPKDDWEALRQVFAVTRKSPAKTDAESFDQMRGRSIIAAAAVSMVGVAIALLVIWYVSIIS